MAKISKATKAQLLKWQEKYKGTEFEPVLSFLIGRMEMYQIRITTKQNLIEELEETLVAVRKEFRKSKKQLKAVAPNWTASVTKSGY